MKALIISLILFSSSALAVIRTARFNLVENGDLVADYGGTYESKVINISGGHRYAWHVIGAAGTGVINTLISGDCVNFQVLPAVSNIATTGDEIVQVSNANYPCAKLQITGTGVFSAYALVKEER